MKVAWYRLRAPLAKPLQYFYPTAKIRNLDWVMFALHLLEILLHSA